MKMGRRRRCSSVTYRLRYARLLAPCRRPILIAKKYMLFRGQDTRPQILGESCRALDHSQPIRFPSTSQRRLSRSESAASFGRFRHEEDGNNINSTAPEVPEEGNVLPSKPRRGSLAPPCFQA